MSTSEDWLRSMTKDELIAMIMNSPSGRLWLFDQRIALFLEVEE